LEVGSGTQAEQTGKIMMAFEKELMANPCNLVMVVGDVNSTMACSIVAKKLNTKVAHVEAGIRSFDMEMPEEINRIVTDALADYFFTTSEIANKNLLAAGAKPEQIFFVGNTMIDTLLSNLPRIKQPDIWQSLHLQEKSYYLLTLHRPSNVDDENRFDALMKEIVKGAAGRQLIFPVHPRTRKMIEGKNYAGLSVIDPLGYLEFIYLVKNARAVVTDSGGIQEETTVLAVPCLTLRNNTERPETMSIGSNELIGDDFDKLAKAFQQVEAGQWKKGGIPPLWDGQTASRIVGILKNLK
ncbi:MAG TPA: UDP-N-acetylglucosamine 2-epimerase (non-hydrolyzing), partial [Cyclobacteriaceae bacterium]|nr:UDP-N-acetylglucosamine 2-epimerase (non-hydrolyzing) [Cyclobacteriaceae bacterium]